MRSCEGRPGSSVVELAEMGGPPALDLETMATIYLAAALKE